MDSEKDFAIKQRKYMPVFPKATGKTTVYIEGYPGEDDEPMAATGFHGVQITTLYDQLKRYFEINNLVRVGVDSFIYYCEGDITKRVAPDIHIVFGVEKYPARHSFYTWAEGAVPVAVFQFLTDATEHQDQHEMVALYLNEIGVQEYFVHQPEMELPPVFRGWRRSPSGCIEEITQHIQGGLFSETLNLWFRWENQYNKHVRLLRPYLPDGTPIATSMENHYFNRGASKFTEAVTPWQKEAKRRHEAETRAAEEAQRRHEAETRVAEEAQRLQEAEAELEQLRAQLANRQNDN